MKQKVTIEDFAKALGIEAEAPDIEITGITYNSKEVEPGYLFVCKGAHFKEDYLQEAIKNGALCYVREGESGIDTSKAAVEINVSDIREAMPVIAETFYGKLSDVIKVIGITGTKGKSTTAYYMRYILDDWMSASGGQMSAICSGIDNYDGVSEVESHLTSPEIMELYQHMENAVNSGIGYMTIEVSSQALKYNRVSGINFAAGAFLNIGFDHISDIEHPDFEDYLASKLKIFSQCSMACYSLESDHQTEIRKAAEDCPYVITFSIKDPNANVFGYDLKSEDNMLSFRAKGSGIKCYPDFDESFSLSTFASINVENALAAISLSVLLKVPMEHIKSGLEKASVPGRLELFKSEDGKRIAVVDYAHNELSYKAFFNMASEKFPGRKVICVFGSTGGKAVNRRKELGRIAGKYAGYSIITEDDSGPEDVMSICLEIAAHVEAEGGTYEIIPDRVDAIKKGIAMSDENTILFVAGRGRDSVMKREGGIIDYPADTEVIAEKL